MQAEGQLMHIATLISNSNTGIRTVMYLLQIGQTVQLYITIVALN